MAEIGEGEGKGGNRPERVRQLAARKNRLAKALRENLRRRKAGSEKAQSGDGAEESEEFRPNPKRGP